jgi:hypothetical protein
MIDILWWYRPFLYEGLCPIFFLGNWVLVVSYLCSRFRIFDKFASEGYFFRLKGAHTCFNHAYVQCKMALLLQLRRCTLLLKVWQLLVH